MFHMGHCKALFEEICKKTDYAKARIFEQGGHQAMTGLIFRLRRGSLIWL